MTLSIASKSSGTSSTSGTVTITKPTGLAEGDMMVAFLTCAMDGNETANWATPSGWTNLQGLSTGNDGPLFVFAIVATATEVAASNFTFTENNASVDDDGIGAILRITTTTSFVSPAVNILSAGSYGTTYSGISNTLANSLLLLGGGFEDTGNYNFTGWAVTNNNPTWTEEYDLNNGAGAIANLGVASATYTAGGDTGNFTPGGSSTLLAGVLVSIIDAIDVTVSPSVINLTSSVQSPSVSGDANVTVSSSVDLTSSVQSPTITTGTGVWSNQSKNSMTNVSNQSKS